MLFNFDAALQTHSSNTYALVIAFPFLLLLICRRGETCLLHASVNVARIIRLAVFVYLRIYLGRLLHIYELI